MLVSKNKKLIDLIIQKKKNLTYIPLKKKKTCRFGYLKKLLLVPKKRLVFCKVFTSILKKKKDQFLEWALGS